MRFRWRALLAFALVAALAWSARYFHADDALIYARYVRNALHGNGLVFNPGERVNALTSPLHTCLLLFCRGHCTARVLLAEWLLGVGFLAATVVLAERVVPFSGIMVASIIFFEIFLGMETSLFIFLLLLSVVLYGYNRWSALPVVLCLLTLTRFEGAILVGAVAWQMYRQKRWPRWQTFLPAFAILLAYLVANHHLYGRWLPSSGTAKLQQGLSGYWGRWPTAFFHLPHAFWYPLRSFSYTVPLALWLAWRGKHTEQAARWNAIVLPFLGIVLAFCTLANVTGYLWYYAPFILFALLYAAMGMPRTRIAYVTLAAIMVHGTILGCILLRRAPAMYTHYIYLANYLNRQAPPGATVATVETGTIGWYCNHPVIDIVGLTTPRNATLLAHHDTTTWLAEEKPDYVIIHTPQAAVGEGAALNNPDYERLPVELENTYLMKRK